MSRLQLNFYKTVDGRNPANQLIDVFRCSYYLITRFYTSQVVNRISSYEQ